MTQMEIIFNRVKVSTSVFSKRMLKYFEGEFKLKFLTVGLDNSYTMLIEKEINPT